MFRMPARENDLKIKQPETLILPPEELYVSKEVKENALGLEGKSCRPK